MPQSPVKILLASHSSELGGAERCLLSLVEGLDRARFTPVVAVPAKGRLAERLDAIGVETHVTPLRWWVGIRSDTRARRLLFAKGLRRRVERLANLIRRTDAKIVVSNTLVFLEAALAARFTRRPHGWHALEMLGRDPDLRPLFPLSEFFSSLDDLSDAFVAVSEGVAEELRPHLKRSTLQIIHTGIRTSVNTPSRGRKAELFGFSEDTPVVCYAGLLSARKGVLDLARAAQLVIASYPAARFVFAGGEGGVGNELRQYIASQRLTASVHLLGFRRDALDLIANSDVFVLPSVADPLPVSVLEAMSVGTPVVATRSGGCSEMVVDGQTGYLVPVSAPPALAEAIGKLLQDPRRARAMGGAGQERVSAHFRIPQNVNAFQDLFSAIAVQNPPPDAPNVARSVTDRIVSGIERECAGVLPSLGSLALRSRELLSRTPLRTGYQVTRTVLQRARLT